MQLPNVERPTTRSPAVQGSAAPVVAVAQPQPLRATTGSQVSSITPPLAAAAPTASPSSVPSPSIIDRVNPALKSLDAGPLNRSADDPQRVRPEEATAPKDYTIRKPPAEKPVDPPPPALVQVLIDNLRTVWAASRSAIQTEQIKEAVEPALRADPSQVLGAVAKEALTYEPAKIKKTEKL